VNLLFVSETDFTRKIVFDVHLLPEAMSLRGHKIFMLYYESMWNKPDNNKKLWVDHGLSKEIIANRALDNAHIHLIKPKFIRLHVLSRASAFITHLLEINRVIHEEKIDAVVLYSVPTNGLQAVWYARKAEIPVLFRSLDVLNKLVSNSLLRYPTKVMESKVYSRVDRFLALTPNLCDYAVSLGAKKENTRVLPMTVDTNTFYPMMKSKVLMNRWGLTEDDKVLLFMGTLFNFSGLDEFISSTWERFKNNPDIKLLIVGDGEQRILLESLITKYNLNNQISITGFQPYDEMPLYINLADVCINPFKENDITRDIFPGKTVQFLACGKPLVMRPLRGVHSMIEGVKQGVIYLNDNWPWVFDILRQPQLLKEIGDAGLRYVKEMFSYEKVSRQLEEEIMECISERDKE